MTVYVDDSRMLLGRMFMCHMIATSDVELHGMAVDIGIARRWHQKPPKASHSHYDICQSKKAAAIAAGAVAVTRRQCVALVAMRRDTGMMGTPEEAERWWADRAREAKKARYATAPQASAAEMVKCAHCRKEKPKSECRPRLARVVGHIDWYCATCPLPEPKPARRRYR